MPRDKKVNFDQLSVGDNAEIRRTLTQDALDGIVLIFGDPDSGGESDWFAARAAPQPIQSHTTWLGALISATFALVLPDGERSRLVQTVRFHQPVKLGDSVTVAATVIEKVPDGGRLVLDCIARNQRGQTVASGTTEATFPPT